MCKLYCAQSACEVIDDAMQILGGLGYTDDSRVSRFWRDTRVTALAAAKRDYGLHLRSPDPETV
jgi:alkylation response protein AidB-like acyl-CoA dehydrogenase